MISLIVYFCRCHLESWIWIWQMAHLKPINPTHPDPAIVPVCMVPELSHTTIGSTCVLQILHSRSNMMLQDPLVVQEHFDATCCICILGALWCCCLGALWCCCLMLHVMYCLSFMWLRFCLCVHLSICPVVPLSSAADGLPLFNLEEAHQGDQERHLQ